MALASGETVLLGRVDLAEMRRHVEFLCGFDKTSGTEGEARAASYIAETLESYGVTTHTYTFGAYLSYPMSAGLEIEGLGAIRAKTRAFSESTPAGGVTGEVCYVPGAVDMFTDTETVERIKALDLSGKIVLSEGGGRQNMLVARQKGAIGYIHMWPSDEDVIHEGIVTPIWGTPTPGTIDTLPHIPVISITKGDALKTKALLGERKVTAHINTVVETGWQKVTLTEAEIPGKSAEYVLIGGHLDSWHIGATDNVTGNVTCLELARVLNLHKDELVRGVKIAWWPGHSTGRYAGSTWYCDRFWQDLRDNCVTYINIDSPGVLGAYDYSAVTAVAENEQFAADIVTEITGQTPEDERPSRAGDQSFWGPGISSLFMLLSNRPPGQRAQVGGSGMGWWWHTEQDTLDKVEMPVLEKDWKVYALATYRLCTCEVLPLKVSGQAREIKMALESMCQGTPSFDMAPALAEAKSLLDVAVRFEAALDKLVAAGEAIAGPALAKAKSAANQTVLRAVKTLTPVLYSPVDRFDQGPATPIKPVPALVPAASLEKMDPSSDEYRFLVTSLTRKRNSVVWALVEARRALQESIVMSVDEVLRVGSRRK